MLLQHLSVTCHSSTTIQHIFTNTVPRLATLYCYPIITVTLGQKTIDVLIRHYLLLCTTI